MYGRNNFNNTNYNHNNNHNNNSYNNGNRNTGFAVEITGWDNADIPNITSFIFRKTNVKLTNAHSQGRMLHAQVRSERELTDVLRCSGMRFAGQTLTVSRSSNNNGLPTNNNNNNNNKKAGDTIQILKNILATRYNPQAQMLDLTNLINDPLVIQNNLISTNNVGSKFFTALMKIASDQKLNLESVNLSMNNIDNHSRWLFDLALSFPQVKNLALGGNRISKIDIFDKLKNKFTMLRELILQGNPISQDMNSLKKIVLMFPKLIIIDSNQVRNEQKLNSILNFPVISKSIFFETSDLQRASTDFVKSFLSCWDSNRLDLMGLYTPQTQFSFQLDTTSVADSTNLNTSTNAWNNYTPNSRNLKKLSQERSRMQRLSLGQEQISKAFLSLPLTQHNPDLAMETMMYPPINGMIITIHGDFNETGQPQITVDKKRQKPALQKRSFDRTWIIVPGGSSGLLIVSDLLMIRNYCANKVWSNNNNNNSNNNNTTPTTNTNTIVTPPLGTPPGTSTPTPAPALTPIPPSSTAANRNELALKVQKETNLKPEFVMMLLEQSNWDYETAGRNFMANRSSIPPDAFQ